MAFAATTARHRSVLWFGALFLLVVCAEHAITTLPAFRQRPLLPWGVTFDLLVVLPGLFYLLVVRRYAWPPSTVAGAVGVGLALAYALLPEAQQQPLQALRFLPAALEAVTVAGLGLKVRQLVRHYRQARAHEARFWPCARTAVQQALGLPGVVLVAELDMLRYALLGWWTAADAGRPGAVAFSNYRESGFLAFVVMAGVALGVETVVVHLLAAHWSATLALWLLWVDAYAIAFCVAHAHAVRLMPTLVTADEVQVRVGFLWHIAVPRAQLLAVEPLRGAPPGGPGLLQLNRQLFTTPNLLLTFAGPVAVTGPYGIRRTASRVVVYLDDPQHFMAEVGHCSPSSTR